jgi:hypothetical protein
VSQHVYFSAGLKFVRAQVESVSSLLNCHNATYRFKSWVFGCNQLLPILKHHNPIGQYAGARTNCDQGSYIVIHNDGRLGDGITTILGVRSTGVTTCNTLARKIVGSLFGSYCNHTPNPEKINNDFISRPRPAYPGWFVRKNTSLSPTPTTVVPVGASELITCYCQNVTKNEIKELLRFRFSRASTHICTICLLIQRGYGGTAYRRRKATHKVRQCYCIL